MRARGWLEWMVLAGSALVVVAVAGVLLVDGFAGGADPADPVVELRASEGRASGHGWLVPATVTNAGDEAAVDVQIEATATVAGAEEVSEITVAFLPAASTVEVQIGFSGRPEGEVAVRVVGFAGP